MTDNSSNEAKFMRAQLYSKTNQMLTALLLCFAFGSAYAAFSGGKEGIEYSGGVIYSGEGDPIGSYCAGTPTGGKYASESYSGNSGCNATVPGTDTDGDSMDDTWEETYALNQYDANDRYGDDDGDGSTNAREKALGSIPKGTGSACPGFSTTTITDADCDGVTDSDDPDPDNASVTSLTVDGTYKGGRFSDAKVATP